MDRLRINNAHVITGGDDLGICSVLVEDGRIIGIERQEIDFPCERVIDSGGNYLFPGFIDIHTHGSGNYDFMDCTPEACLGIAKEHARHGATLMFPTTLASDAEELFRFLDIYDEVKAQNVGTAFGGLHLEGPFFAYAFRGAQDQKYLKNPTPELYLPILERSKDIKRWSIAPELPGALELGSELYKREIVASIAHTDALYDDVIAAYKSGYSLMTHFYSCMNGVTRRNAFRYAGCVEAGYLIDDMDLEVICDGIHVPAPLLKLIRKNKSLDHIILCTDSMRGAGMPEGSKSILGSLSKGQEVLIEDGVAKMPDRTCFAGSVCTCERLVRTMYTQGGASLPEAVKMTTENPARVMGVSDRKGSVKINYDADLVICDKEISVLTTIVGGRIVYQR